jgi:hypothetical protein
VIAECNCRVQAVSADSCSEGSRSKQSEMKTAGNRLHVDCCVNRDCYMCGIAIAL